MDPDNNLKRLIIGCRKKRESSQIQLYRLYYGYGLGVCLRYAHNRESAMEMLNDGFLNVFQKIDQYRQDQPFKPWLRKIMIHAAIDHYRKYNQPRLETIELHQEPPALQNEALDQLNYDDLLMHIQKLPDAYRMVFNLFVVEGFSHQEIAETLNISIGTSKSNLSKARRKLQQYLNEQDSIALKSNQYG